MINQKRHNTILYLHSIWLSENAVENIESVQASEQTTKERK